MPEQRFIIGPRDAVQGFRVARAAAEYLRATAHRARDEGKPQEIIFREQKKTRSDPQLNTLWMWHGQVASELSIRSAMRWTKDDIHEEIFLKRWMPYFELLDPTTGEVKSRPMRTSERETPEGDERSPRQAISDAMTQYLAWTCENGIEVTVPQEGW